MPSNGDYFWPSCFTITAVADEQEHGNWHDDNEELKDSADYLREGINCFSGIHWLKRIIPEFTGV